VEAVKNISGTSIANLNPDERPEKWLSNIATLDGITNWFQFIWPSEGEYAGHICARALPGFGQWNIFSVSDVKKAIKNQEFTKPNPQTSDCTILQLDWIVLLPSKSTYCV